MSPCADVNPASEGQRRTPLPVAQIVAVLALGTKVLIGGTATVQNIEQITQPGSRPRGRLENLRFETADVGVVQIVYDLLSDDPETLFDVALQVSQDGGETFDFTATAVSGDVGAGVRAGAGKQIQWDAGQDVERVAIERFRYRVIVATDPVLVVRSVPTGASVSIDGTMRGQTPLSLDDLPPGEHRVTIAQAGYLDNMQLVRLQANAEQTIEVSLTTAAATTQPALDSPRQLVVESGNGGSRLPLILALAGGGAAAVAVAVLAGGGDACTFSVSPASNSSVSSSGGAFMVNVTASSTGCSWTARSNAPWITITSGSSGTMSGTVRYTVAPTTTGAGRQGSLTIAGRTVNVVQAANLAPTGGRIVRTPSGTGLASATSFTFTAEGVSDPEGDPITYLWEFGDGSGNPPSASTVSKTYPRAGTYPVRLGVTDGVSPVRVAAQIDLRVKDLTGTWDGSFNDTNGIPECERNLVGN